MPGVMFIINGPNLNLLGTREPHIYGHETLDDIAASLEDRARELGLSVDVRQSKANGGGPACLRLRVVADPETVDPRFLVDDAKLDVLSEVVREHWPVEIANDDLKNPRLVEQVQSARLALLEALDLTELA